MGKFLLCFGIAGQTMALMSGIGATVLDNRSTRAQALKWYRVMVWLSSISCILMSIGGMAL